VLYRKSFSMTAASGVASEQFEQEERSTEPELREVELIGAYAVKEKPCPVWGPHVPSSRGMHPRQASSQ
jgi:hypothetical protein